MFINRNHEGEILILELSGRLDTFGAIEFESRLQEACDEGSHTVVVDMSDVHYVNSTGLRVLAQFLKLSSERNCDLRLVGLSANVEKAIGLVGLQNFFRPYVSVQAALNN